MEEFNETKKENKKSKKLNIIIIVLILLIVIAIGTSYAQWNYNFIGQLTNSISTEDIKLEFLESQDNVINITNALPLSDEEGKKEETFDFAVTSKTKKEIVLGYTLSIQKLEADTGYTFLNDEDIKIYLEDFQGNALLEPTKVSSLDNYKFYSNLHEHSTSNETLQDKYKLRVWIDESKENDAKNWNTSTKLQYKFKVNVASEEVESTITVTFDANGGTTPISTKKVAANNLYGNLPIPTREGYTFKGWNGKNLVDNNKVIETNDSTISNTDTGFTYTRTSSSSNNLFVASVNLDLKANTTYIFTFYTVNPISPYVYSDNLWGNILIWSCHYYNNRCGNTFTTDNTGHVVLGFYSVGQSQGSTGEISYIMIEEGTEATPYEPYYIKDTTKVVQTSNHTLKAIWEENS